MTNADDEFDAYVLSHERIHAALTLELHDHERLPSHAGIDARVRSLEDYALTTRTYGQMLRVIFGASVLGAIIGILTLATLIEHLVQ